LGIVDPAGREPVFHPLGDIVKARVAAL